ncbi:4-hydroxybenzoyl-CoA thioesterase [Domibacillus antri]|uniref:4-hydroxybenzoyl-CoA thioesterase n=1 Tax=Domibacillus antri TaxID=1714264 RepID=A0A1Q8Q497_9BACI|nr:thioesterase family protein [Domibacillus antri]OLN22115.1 4-hydroxybenzoyl-CoA thioesterase [Domibacillus antri]
MRKSELQLLVNWGDTDVAGIVYYPNFFKWFDIAGHHFFRNAGLSPHFLAKEKSIILPMLDAQCTFEHALHYDDELTIKTEVSELNRKTIKLRHEIYVDGKRAANGYELRGWVEKKPDGTISAVLIPEEIRVLLMEEKTEKRDSRSHPLFNA